MQEKNILNHKKMDNLHNRLNLDLSKKTKIFHHSQKEHRKISKTANFGCEML